MLQVKRNHLLQRTSNIEKLEPKNCNLFLPPARQSSAQSAITSNECEETIIL